MKKPDYKLVPMGKITKEARELAVLWCEGYEPLGVDIEQKHKLASDIMNYSNVVFKRNAPKIIREYAKSILHGDVEHRQWLLDETEKFIEEKWK